ncbi:MAG: hypothetical protein ACREGD_03565 [Candidatus Saccharimonadales bacterium]
MASRVNIAEITQQYDSSRPIPILGNEAVAGALAAYQENGYCIVSGIALHDDQAGTTVGEAIQMEMRKLTRSSKSEGAVVGSYITQRDDPTVYYKALGVGVWQQNTNC